jgi:hypothetical protein
MQTGSNNNIVALSSLYKANHFQDSIKISLSPMMRPSSEDGCLLGCRGIQSGRS